MPILPVEFLSNNLTDRIFIQIKRFDSKSYNLDTQSFEAGITPLIPLKRGNDKEKYILSTDLDIAESELVPGYYSIYFYNVQKNIIDISSFEVKQYLKTQDIAARILSSTIGDKPLRVTLKEISDKVNLIHDSLKSKGII